VGALERLAARHWRDPDPDAAVKDLRVKALGLLDGLTPDDVCRHQQRLAWVLEVMSLGVLKALGSQ
jgi:hypothetical protein